VPRYGLIETPDRREIYFLRNGVTQPGVDRVEIGPQVEFVDAPRNEGPQARRVSRDKRPVPG
jgi:cold shock CspA family protein